jgi:cytohesin
VDIHDAAAEGNIEAVKQHLAAGADVNAKTLSGRTPLGWAALRGHKGIVELLIAEGANMNGKSDEAGTPLHDAAWGGHKQIVELLIAKGADVNAKIEGDGTPLHYAARKGRKEIAELLIAKGTDVNAKNEEEYTPLHYSAAFGQKEVAELLISEGADVNAKTKRGETPLDWAKKYPETADLLRKHGGKTGELKRFTATSQPEPTTAKAPDISIFDAAEDGNIEAVKQHLAAGTDVNAKDDDGFTPLNYAVPAGKEETADLLRKHGGISGAEDSIHVAAIMGNIEAVKQHLAAGADVNAKDKYGRTPLTYATNGGNTETEVLLRKHGGKTGAELKAEGK